jgi:hypothetical protein
MDMDRVHQNEPETPLAGSPDRLPAEYPGDEVNAGLIGIVGVFAAVVLLLIIVLVQAWYYTWKGQVASDREVLTNSPDMPLGRMLAEQEQQIGSYHWVNREKQVRAIPIDQAMALVAEELAAGQGRLAPGTAAQKMKTEVKHEKADKP